MADDYYKVLGVQRTASLEDIQDALRQENIKWSRRSNNAPKAADRAEAEQRVELLAQIKGVLTNPIRKAEYDATLGGAHGKPSSQPQPNPWPPPQPDPWPPPDRRPQPNSDARQPDAGRFSGGKRRGVVVAGRLIRHPVWTAILVVIALSAFAAAGNSQSAAGNLILGVVCVLIALRVSGLWRRR
jgi:curved DNA-binding protein CbpA